MAIPYISGRPGVGSAITAGYGRVFRADEGREYFPHGGTIDGSSRYPLAGASVYFLPSGLLMGQVTATKKWKPSLIDATVGAYTSGGTTLTLSLAGAAELVRRNGASGTFTLKSAATSGGALTTDTVTYSAVNTATGVVTITNIGANRIAGGLVVNSDGSENPRSVIDDGLGINMPLDGSDREWPQIPTAGFLDVDRIIGYSAADATLKQFIKDQLCANGRGLFTFSDEYAAA